MVMMTRVFAVWRRTFEILPPLTRTERVPFGREFRLGTLLLVIFVLSLFDLALTQSQLPRGNFREANAVAAGIVAGGGGPAAAYKCVLLGTGLVLLYRCRRHWTAEAGAWGLAGVHGGLMVWWSEYLDALEICLTDVAVVTTPVPL